jgi:hypothetical protein
MKLGVQLAIEDHEHLLEYAKVKSRSVGATVGVPPISAILAYHISVLQRYEETGALTSQDFLDLRRKNSAISEAMRVAPGDDRSESEDE